MREHQLRRCCGPSTAKGEKSSPEFAAELKIFYEAEDNRRVLHAGRGTILKTASERLPNKR